MKKLLIVLFLIILSGCSNHMGLTKVWPTKSSGIIFQKYGPPINSVAAPKGFLITPLEVSEMCSPSKYLIVIYADETHYYVAKGSADQREVVNFGEKIDGRTGEITHPLKKNKRSIIYIRKYSDLNL